MRLRKLHHRMIRSRHRSTTPTVALQTAAQLDSLVAPIALYPDALVAQVLAAATLPEQVAFAEDWLQQNNNLTGSALTQAVNQQSWDPSVKALTQFPSVLNDLAKNLSWTSNLGQAYVNQQSDVMAAVQSMRAQAQQAGTLQSSSQITVVQQSPSTIVIKPANPNVVYVPQYNPTVVYGAPYVVPAYTPPVAIATAGVSFAAGVAVGAAIGGGGYVGGGFVGGGFGWGFGAWGMNWGGGGGGGKLSTTTTPTSTRPSSIGPQTTPTTGTTPGARMIRAALSTIWAGRPDRRIMRGTARTAPIIPTATTSLASIPIMVLMAPTIPTVISVLTAAGTKTSPAPILMISRTVAITATMA